MSPPPVTIWDDDGPIGKTARLEVSCGGNLDYYLTIIGEDWAGKPLRSDGFRAATSGARVEVVTTVIATLYAIGRGDRERALRLARALVQELEDKLVRLPDPKDSTP